MELEKLLLKYNLTEKELSAILRDNNKPNELEKLLNNSSLSLGELRAIIKSAKGKPSRITNLDVPDSYIKIGYFSDPHIGHDKFSESGFSLMRRVFKEEGVDFVICAGDNLEGMSGREGHVYELTHTGFQKQFDYCRELYSSLDLPIFGIDGNHDEWYKNKNNAGVVVGENLEQGIEKYTHLGEMEGVLQLTPHSKIMLYHGRDGTAYADSYKIQKLIESFSEKEKPSIVFSGHYHKSLFVARRDIFGFESGTLCGQTKFMRGKKLQAHMGFGVVDIYLGKKGVDRLKHEWFQLYPKLDKSAMYKLDFEKIKHHD